MGLKKWDYFAGNWDQVWDHNWDCVIHWVFVNAGGTHWDVVLGWNWDHWDHQKRNI